MAVRISAALPGPSASVRLAMQADYDAWPAEHHIDISCINGILPKLSHEDGMQHIPALRARGLGR